MFGPEGELVGPNSAIFRGEGQGGFFREDIRPNLPLGARYDPVHPFDNPQRTGPGLNPGSEFFGFDEFGRPLTKPKPGPFGPNSGPGGFGGFGGFGGQPRDFI